MLIDDDSSSSNNHGSASATHIHSLPDEIMRRILCDDILDDVCMIVDGTIVLAHTVNLKCTACYVAPLVCKRWAAVISPGEISKMRVRNASINRSRKNIASPLTHAVLLGSDGLYQHALSRALTALAMMNDQLLRRLILELSLCLNACDHVSRARASFAMRRLVVVKHYQRPDVVVRDEILCDLVALSHTTALKLLMPRVDQMFPSSKSMIVMKAILHDDPLVMEALYELDLTTVEEVQNRYISFIVEHGSINIVRTLSSLPNEKLQVDAWHTAHQMAWFYGNLPMISLVKSTLSQLLPEEMICSPMAEASFRRCVRQQYQKQKDAHNGFYPSCQDDAALIFEMQKYIADDEESRELLFLGASLLDAEAFTRLLDCVSGLLTAKLCLELYNHAAANLNVSVLSHIVATYGAFIGWDIEPFAREMVRRQYEMPCCHQHILHFMMLDSMPEGTYQVPLSVYNTMIRTNRVEELAYLFVHLYSRQLTVTECCSLLTTALHSRSCSARMLNLLLAPERLSNPCSAPQQLCSSEKCIHHANMSTTEAAIASTVSFSISEDDWVQMASSTDARPLLPRSTIA